MTRLSIDHLRSARVRRESYVGPWLPEPLIADESHDPGDLLVMSESVSTAFLLMLESLTPIERAVFVLRQVFDYDYTDIARMVEKSEANCRQMMRRARQRLADGRRRFRADPAAAESLTRQFLAAIYTGDVEGLVSLLTDDATVYTDGGGQVQAARNPVSGAQNGAQFMVGLARKMGQAASVRPATVGGVPALIFYGAAGQPFGVLTFEFSEGHIRNVYLTINPAKLRHVPALH